MASLEIILEKRDKTCTDEEKNTLYRERPGRMTPSDLSDDMNRMLEALRKTNLKSAKAPASSMIEFKHAIMYNT